MEFLLRRDKIEKGISFEVKTKSIKVICLACGKYLDHIEALREFNQVVMNPLCRECFEKFVPESERKACAHLNMQDLNLKH